jgi:hypothetical protein
MGKARGISKFVFRVVGVFKAATLVVSYIAYFPLGQKD